MTAVYIMLIVLSIIMLILLIPTDCIFKIFCNDKNANGEIFIKYAFYKTRIYPNNSKKIDGVESDEKNSVTDMISFSKTSCNTVKSEIKSLIKYLANHAVRIKKLDVTAKIGTGNPMYTGIAYGTLSAFVYNLVGILDNKMRLDDHNVKLDADFDNACIDAKVYCKIRTRMLHAFVIAGYLIKIVVKIRKTDRRIKEDV